MNSKVYPIIPRYKMLKDMIKNAMRDPAYMEGKLLHQLKRDPQLLILFCIFHLASKSVTRRTVEEEIHLHHPICVSESCFTVPNQNETELLIDSHLYLVVLLTTCTVTRSLLRYVNRVFVSHAPTSNVPFLFYSILHRIGVPTT